MIPGTEKKKKNLLIPMPFVVHMKIGLLNQIHMDQRSYPVKLFIISRIKVLEKKMIEISWSIYTVL